MEQKKKTEFLTELKIIEKMVSCYFSSNVDVITRRSLALGISFETQTLVAKLEILKEQWRTKLPFWEDWDVKFADWKSKIKIWINKKDKMSEPNYTTECDYPLLDSDVDEHSLDKASVIAAIKKDVENFEDRESVGEACRLFSLNVVFDYTFDDALKRLLEAIEGCERMLTTHNAESYIELYQRLLNNFVAEEKYDVEVQIEKAIMSLPNNNRLSMLKKMFERECNLLYFGIWKLELQNMLPIVNPETPLSDENIGKFLSRYRNMLTSKDVIRILPQYYKLSLLNKAIIVERAKEVEANLPSIEYGGSDYCHLFLKHNLADNDKAMLELRRVVTLIDKHASSNKGKRSEKWKWVHLRSAMHDENIDFIDKDISISNFGLLISDILFKGNVDDKKVEKKANAVSQSLKELPSGFPKNHDKTIIGDMKKLLQPIKKIIENN